MLEKAYGCEVIITGELFHERFNHAIETQLYRICQEAITNACEHSGADYVEVLVEEAGDWIHVSVIDKGCGFDIHSPKIQGSGCGLLGMRERADIIGAILDIKSNNAGTQVTIAAPMYLEEEKTK